MALSVGDILTALIYIPTHIIVVHLASTNSCTGYSIEKFNGVFLGTSSTILTSIICMDRYFFVKRPYRNSLGSTQLTTNQQGILAKRVFVIYGTVTYTIALSLGITVTFIANGTISFRTAATIFNIVSIAVYTSALLVSLVFNTLLVLYIRKKSREIKRQPSDEDTSYQTKVTKTVLMISGIQFFTIIPWVIALIAMSIIFTKRHYFKYATEIHYMHIWLKMPMFLNSSLNAVVFICRNRSLMGFYRSLLTRLRCSTNAPQSSVVALDCIKNRIGLENAY